MLRSSLLVIMCLTLSATKVDAWKAKKPDFDLYNSFSMPSSSYKTEVVKPTKKLGVKKFLLDLVKYTGNLGGLIFLGMKVIQYVEKHHGPIIPRELITLEDINNTMSNMNTTSVSKVNAEVEELWRVIHDLNAKQNDRLDKIESSQRSVDNLENQINQCKQQIDELSALTSTLKNDNSLADNMDIIESKLNALNKTFVQYKEEKATESEQQNTATAATTITNAPSMEEFQQLYDRVNAFQNHEIKELLKDHDDMILNKLQKFGDSVKNLISTTMDKKKSEKSKH